MKTGTCPNCGSKNIFTKPKGAQFGSGGFYVNTSSVSSPVNYESYICGDCGLYQTFVADVRKLAEVKQKWDRVS